MPDPLLLLITGLAAGVFAGMFGIGGGVIIVPALMLLFSFTPVLAISTSLASMLLPVGIFAVLSYRRADLLSIRSAALIAAGLLITSFVGAAIALALPAETLKQAYGVFLILMSWRFAEPRKVYAEIQSRRAGVSIPKPPAALVVSGSQDNATPWLGLFGLGLVAGVLSGLFGIGGGAVIVPALVGFLKYDQKLAVGTSLAALLLPVGLPGVVRYYQAGQLDLGVAIPIAFGLAFGSLGGARLALRLPSQTVRRLYGVFLLFAGVWFILQPGVTAAVTS
ncbi:MAG: sulfite exporter TauE/SafE family protein [Armatimonadetes bacterium]|nr:sulfite exporter TauE/SafE family protein [Anaerolineae bacterium]